MSAPPPPPQSFPYDHLFKILTIGDAGVGKVREAVECFLCLCWYQFSSGAGFGLRRREETVMDVRSQGVTYFGRERLPFLHATHTSTYRVCQRISATMASIVACIPAAFLSNSLSQTFSFFVSAPPPTRQSSILLRFTDDSFDDHIQSTIGVDFKVKHMDVMDKRVKLTVWDTAGQERFRTLTSSYYRGAQGVIMVYDVTRRDSFENLDTWLKEIKLYSPNNGEGVVKLLVGNKIDLERRVPREEAEAWARRHGMLFLEASAKTRTGIRQCFMEVVQKILEDPDLLMHTVPGRPKVQLRPQGRQGGASLLEDDDEGLCC